MKSLYFLLPCLLLQIWSCNSQESELNHKCEFKEEISIIHDKCGYVEVPNSWKNKANGNTKIAYLVLESKSENRKEDPLVFLQGGPGGSVLPMANVFINLNLDPERDFILYDQRGIGFSDALCPDMGESFTQIIANDISIEQEDDQLFEASADCIKSMSDKNFKRSFGTTESVRDLEALRKHLGYDQINLFGASYGTRLGLKYMEMFPISVRASILTGLFPPEIRFYDKMYTNLNRSLERLFSECTNDTECSVKYPELKSTFESVANNLEINPRTVVLGDTDFVVNKHDFLLLLHQLMYNRQTIAFVPSFIASFKNDNDMAIVQSIQLFLTRMNAINIAAYWSITASDESKSDNDKLLKTDAKQFKSLSSGLGFFASDPSILKKWPSIKGDFTPMKKIESEIPTLLVSGAYDPVTPPSNGELVLKSLKNASHVIYPDDGHCPMNSCFFELSKMFLDNPNKTIEGTCAEKRNPIGFN